LDKYKVDEFGTVVVLIATKYLQVVYKHVPNEE